MTRMPHPYSFISNIGNLLLFNIYILILQTTGIFPKRRPHSSNIKILNTSRFYSLKWLKIEQVILFLPNKNIRGAFHRIKFSDSFPIMK